MITEHAVLQVRPGESAAFEAAFAEASPIIASMHGYQGHSLLQCIEDDHRYLLLVEWDTLEDHTKGFRGSTEYQEWKTLLHHFYDPFPEVDHYRALAISES